ncbi:MAG TPA: 4Fe-4S dicluster domain-containing protein [Candidatus Dormibacteraeota bacterium]|nr:4Fe-4S dicluster domain-containing protein [Candidatus Dormibacteraeota bacterium]
MTTLQERLSTVRFRPDPEPHIVVDGDVCRECSLHACVTACPAGLFTPLSDGTVVFSYEECFECGTCYVACNREGAIRWRYPGGGYGVAFRDA